MELPTLSPPPLIARLTAILGLTGCVLLSVIPPSTSRLLVWPWSTVTVAFWGLIGVAGVVALLGRSRLPARIEQGLLMLAGVAVLSAYSSPFRDLSLPAAWVTVGACLLPIACLPWISGPGRAAVMRWIGWAVLAILAASLGHWIVSQVAPLLQRGASLVQALAERNEQPFGHANYNAAFALLALGWMSACLAPWLAARLEIGATLEKSPFDLPPPELRGEWVLGLVLALVMLLTSGSRAGIGALALGLTVGLALARRHVRPLSRRTRIAVLAVVLGALVIGILSNGRLRTLVLEGRWNASASESNQQRLGMTQGALRLGTARPVLGWGPGTVPQIFPSVRSELAGNVDNVLQVHSSALQSWATLGGAGVLGAGLLGIGALGLGWSLRRRDGSAVEGLERAALAGGLASYAAYSFFDHSLDIPALAGLAGVTLAGLVPPDSAGAPPRTRTLAAFALIAGLVLVPGVLHEQQARRLHALALDAADRRDAPGYLQRLAEGSARMPGATYLDHLRAGVLATGEPFGVTSTAAERTAAIELLIGTLNRNPSLEYAHYNLGWLLLDSRPAEAERHFATAARLAPHRVGMHLGLALARASLGNAQGAVGAFAAERVNAPEQAFAVLFRDASVGGLASDVEAAAVAFLQQALQRHSLPAPEVEAVLSAWKNVRPEQVRESDPFRRVRPGYGLLMGFPEGRPPSDVNPMTRLLLPPEVARTLPKPGWVPAPLLLELSLGASFRQP